MICRRITGSRPSTGSSRISSSGRQQMASQKAACFCMPLENRRMGWRWLSSKQSAQPVEEGLVEPGIGGGVELPQIPETVAALVEDLVGDIDHTRLLVVIFIDRLLVQGDGAAVGR